MRNIDEASGGPTRALARRIDHVGVLVRDADTAARHFARRFGLSVGSDWTDPQGRFRLVYLDAGDTTLQLVQPLAAGPLSTDLAARGEGLHHMCFSVGDIDLAVSELGVPTEGAPYLGGRGARVCFLTERSHGVLVELTDHGPDPMPPATDGR